MLPPPYTERSRSELKKALRWGQEVCSLQHWDLRLIIKYDLAEIGPPFDSQYSVGGIQYSVEHLYANVGIQLKSAKEQNADPLHALFHELSHLVLVPIHRGESWKPVEEQAANRIAAVLLRLWEETHG